MIRSIYKELDSESTVSLQSTQPKDARKAARDAKSWHARGLGTNEELGFRG